MKINREQVHMQLLIFYWNMGGIWAADAKKILYRGSYCSTATATATVAACVTVSSAHKTWIFERFYDSAMPAILEIWILKIF